MRQEILNMTDLERQKLIDWIYSLQTPEDLVVPEGIDKSFTTGPRSWDYAKLHVAFSKVNSVVNKEAIQKALKKAKIYITTLPEASKPKVMLAKLDVRALQNILNPRNDCFQYPKDKKSSDPENERLRLNRRAVFEICLKTVETTSDEGYQQTEWEIKTPIAKYIDRKTRAFMDDISINRDKELPCTPEFEETTLTEEAKHILKTGLSKRHLTSNGHYNYELIQLELYIYHKVFYRPDPKDLQPKSTIHS